MTTLCLARKLNQSGWSTTDKKAMPEKLVHWNVASPSNLHPDFLDPEESSISSTSSLEYINSQLIAHGFAPPPGLCLTGASNEDISLVVKCLLGLLNQRIVRMFASPEYRIHTKINRKICLV